MTMNTTYMNPMNMCMRMHVLIHQEKIFLHHNSREGDQICTLCDREMQRSKHLQEHHEEHTIEAQVMAEAERRGMTAFSNVDNPTERDGSGTTIVDEDTSQEDTLFQRREGKQPSTLNDDGLT
jgi:hypothetical protein